MTLTVCSGSARKLLGIRPYWHADVTIFKTLDNVKHYIHLIVDNCSRKILAWRVSEKLLAANTMEIIQEAWLKRSQTSNSQTLKLIVDGGTENQNTTVEAFLSQPEVSITKLTAQCDILQSNSMAEAANSTLKHKYLYRQPIRDGSQLKALIQKAIDDFNNLRPHNQLKGLTPAEAYLGQTPEEITMGQNRQKALINRQKINKSDACGIC